MDIDYLIDRLETLIRSGKRVPLTGNKIMVDEQECFDLIDQMRITVPEEVKLAKRTMIDRERLLADAKEEARRIIQSAERERLMILDREGLLTEAERRRDSIISSATEESFELRVQAQSLYDESVSQSHEMRDGANNYTVQVLQELENLLSKHLSMVQNGLQSFKEQAEQYQKEMEQYNEQVRPQYDGINDNRNSSPRNENNPVNTNKDIRQQTGTKNSIQARDLNQKGQSASTPPSQTPVNWK